MARKVLSGPGIALKIASPEVIGMKLSSSPWAMKAGIRMEAAAVAGWMSDGKNPTRQRTPQAQAAVVKGVIFASIGEIPFAV